MRLLRLGLGLVVAISLLGAAKVTPVEPTLPPVQTPSHAASAHHFTLGKSKPQSWPSGSTSEALVPLHKTRKNASPAKNLRVAAAAATDPRDASLSGQLTLTSASYDSSQPLPSVELWTIASDGVTPFGAVDSTTVDSAGRFKFSGLTAGSYTVKFGVNHGTLAVKDGQHALREIFFLGGTPTGWGATYVKVAASQAATAATAVIPAYGTITGKITDLGGNPVDGYAVLYSSNGHSDFYDTWYNGYESLTDGTYSIPYVVAGSYKVGFTLFHPSDAYNYNNRPDVWGADYNNYTLEPATPYVPTWSGNGYDYSSASGVTLSSQAQAAVVNAVLTTGASPVAAWPSEQQGGTNPAEANCQCGHGDPIDTASGEFIEPVSDLALPGVGPNAGVGRTYSSAAAGTAGPFGYGWAPSFAMKMSKSTTTTGGFPNVISVSQENGSIASFTLDAISNSYQATSPRLRADLLCDPTSQQCQFIRYNRDTVVFDNTSGAILSESDIHSNIVTYAYDSSGQLSTITASGGRTFTFTWSAGRVASIKDSASRTVSYTYDTSGNLTKVTNPKSAATAYTYDTSHNLLTRTSPGTAKTTNTYDSLHRVLSQTDPIGRKTTFSYSGTTTTTTNPDTSVVVERYANNALVQQTRAAGTADAVTTYFGYDEFNNLIRKTDPLGFTTYYTYGRSNQTAVATPDGAVSAATYDNLLDLVLTDITAANQKTTYTYDGEGNETSAKSPDGRTQSWTYNADGTTASWTNALGGVTTYTYDSAGRRLTATDPNSHTSKQAYNAAGFVVSETNGAGGVTKYTVDALGRKLTSTDPLLKVITYTYDVRGNQITAKDPAANSVSATFDLADEMTSSTDKLGKTSTFTFTSRGQLESTSDPDGHKITKSYNLRGDVVSAKDSLGNLTAFTYDANDRKTSEKLPAGGITLFTYDSLGHIATTTDADGNSTQFGIDSVGRKIWSIDAKNRRTDFGYTGENELAQTCYPDGSCEYYGWNDQVQPTVYINRDRAETDYAYDNSGRLTSKTEPGGAKTAFTYDAADRLQSVKTPSGATLTRSYDADGHLTKLHSSITGTTDSTFTYDSLGNRLSMTDTTSTSKYTYNARDQLLTYTNGAGNALSYAYDSAGLLTSLTYPGNKAVSYAYGPSGEMASMTDWLGNKTSFAWTADDALQSVTAANGVSETRQYDASDQLTSITQKASTSTLGQYSYTFDSLQNVKGGSDSDSLRSSATKTYTFDSGNQLASTAIGGASTAYQVTPGGEVIKAGGDTLAYNAALQLATLTPSTGAATSFVFDANGSRTSSTVAAAGSTPAAKTSYGYAYTGALASVTLPSGTTVSYKADADNLRQQRIKGSVTTKYLWDVSGAESLLVDDGSYSYVYGPGDRPIEQIDNTSGAVYYLHGDALGSVRQITNSSGAVVGASSYDDYGTRTTHTGAIDSTIGFTAALTDSDTGLIYLRARDYDPRTRQFLVIDPADSSSHAPYAYAGNLPHQQSDPSGLCSSGSICNAPDGNALLDAAVWLNNTLTPASNALAGAIDTAVVGAAGFANGLSFGLTGAIVSQISPDAYCFLVTNPAYAVGTLAGTIAGGVLLTLATDGVGAPVAAARGSAVVGEAVVQSGDATAIATSLGGASRFGSVAEELASLASENGPRVARLAQDAKVSSDLPLLLKTARPIGKSPSQNAAAQELIARLKAAGFGDVRVNQQQVNAAGVRVGINRPDIQATLGEKRYYIEYDTDASPRGALHHARIVANDPDAVVILIRQN